MAHGNQPQNQPHSAPAHPVEEGPISIAPRSPQRAALYSVFLPGTGQIYNKQLEKAVLLWIWGALVVGIGVALLFLGLVARATPAGMVRPPLGDWVTDHAGRMLLLWLSLAFVHWVVNVRDAYLSAGAINRGEVQIRYGMRRQMVHVLASQLFGFIPLIGLFFPPAVVAEAIDSVRGRRKVRSQILVREGGQALLEWAITRIAFYGFWVLLALWAVWWLLRGLRLAP